MIQHKSCHEYFSFSSESANSFKPAVKHSPMTKVSIKTKFKRLVNQQYNIDLLDHFYQHGLM